MWVAEEKEIIWALKDACRSDLLSYAQWVHPWFIVKDFHRQITYALEQAFLGKIKKLMIFLPPRSGKSRLVSQIFPARCLGQNPAIQFILASHSPELAREFCSEAKALFKGERHLTIFPPCDLTLDQSDNRETAAGGKYYAVSKGWGVTGKGAHILIIDDIVKDAVDANSAAYSEQARLRYNRALNTRRQNDNSPLIICMTRWHTNDLAGRILKKEEEMRQEGIDVEPFTILSIPALQEDPEYLEKLKAGTASGKYSDKFKSYRPERFSVEYLQGIQYFDPRGFEALYMQNPVGAMSNLLNPDDFMRFKLSDLDHDERKMNLELAVVCDPALSSDAKSSDTAIMCIGRHKGSNELFICDIYAETIPPSIAINYIYRMMHKREAMGFKIRFLGCEDVGGLNAGMVEFRKQLNESQVNTGRGDFLYHYKPAGKGKKEDRLLYTIEPYLSWHRLHLNANIRGDMVAKLEKQLLEFPESSKMDVIDVLAQGIDIRSTMPAMNRSRPDTFAKRDIRGQVINAGERPLSRVDQIKNAQML